MSTMIFRALLVIIFTCTILCSAFGRLELQDRMQMSRFHESGKGASSLNGDDAYIRYLSEYFGRPVQRRSFESNL